MARHRRQTRAPAPSRLILDAGAVIALSRADVRARAALVAAREAGADVSIPVVVVAEAVRGAAADAAVNRIIKAVGTVGVADERLGRTAGRLLGEADSGSTIDALVVATASRPWAR
ncbi:hypothetical protein BH20ACT1_BH20ACT1_04010 [soil metagenome]